jgi:hypothetical protein
LRGRKKSLGTIGVEKPQKKENKYSKEKIPNRGE